MARLTGILPIEGTIGNMTFVNTSEGVVVRKKTSLNGAKMAGNPNFDLLRKRNQEFGASGQHGKLLRDALQGVLHVSDSRMVSRLTGRVLRCAKLDTTSPFGERTIAAGAPEQLEGFEFNKKTSLNGVFKGDFTATVDRVLGTATITIANFHPMLLFVPPSAMVYRFLFGAAAIDFATGDTISGTQVSANYAVGTNGANGMTLTIPLPALGTEPVFLALGVEYLVEINGDTFPVTGRDYGAMGIVKVDV